MSNLGQIVRLWGFSIVLLGWISFSGNAQEFQTVSKVTKDTLWIKWLPTDYATLRKLADGATVSRIEISGNEHVENQNFSLGKKWTIAPVQERFNQLDRNDSLQDRMATFLEPVLERIEGIGLDYFYGMALIENVTHRNYQFALGNVLADPEFGRKKYAYKIEISNTDPLFVVVDARKVTEFTEPEITLNLDKKKTVVCTWDLRKTRKEAFAFDVEHRVGDRQEINDLLNEPYLPFKSEFEEDKDLAEVRHDNPEEGKMHYYRIVGRDAFGERSLFSEWQEIYVPDIIAAYPVIDSVQVDGQNRIVHGHLESNEFYSGLFNVEVQRSSTRDGKYEVIQPTEMPIGTDPFEVSTTVPTKTGDAYYYRISLTSKDDTVVSQPYYFFTLDQEAPKAPQGLEVRIDSTGIAQLQWMTLVDPNLLGYRVFRANSKSEEFIEQTHELVTTTAWNDTLPLDNLTSEIYYFIEGVDANYNQGAHSDTVMGLKPDTIPPLAALIEQTVSFREGIQLRLINSTSEDAEKTILFRNDEEVGIVISQYNDTLLVPGKFYRYHLVTYDRSGNSAKSPSVSQKYEPGFRQAPTGSIRADFQGNFIEINFQLPEMGIYSVEIYRAKVGESLRRWKTIRDLEKRSIRDTNISIGETYEYQVKYITTDGIHSLPLQLKAVF